MPGVSRAKVRRSRVSRCVFVGSRKRIIGVGNNSMAGRPVALSGSGAAPGFADRDAIHGDGPFDDGEARQGALSVARPSSASSIRALAAAAVSWNLSSRIAVHEPRCLDIADLLEDLGGFHEDGPGPMPWRTLRSGGPAHVCGGVRRAPLGHPTPPPATGQESRHTRLAVQSMRLSCGASPEQHAVEQGACREDE